MKMGDATKISFLPSLLKQYETRKISLNSATTRDLKLLAKLCSPLSQLKTAFHFLFSELMNLEAIVIHKKCPSRRPGSRVRYVIAWVSGTASLHAIFLGDSAPARRRQRSDTRALYLKTNSD